MSNGAELYDNCPQNGTHCWHRTGVQMLTHPPQDRKQCCHCGETRNFKKDVTPDRRGHGPYFQPAGQIKMDL